MKAHHWSVGVIVAAVTTIAMIPLLLATRHDPPRSAVTSVAPEGAPEGSTTTAN